MSVATKTHAIERPSRSGPLVGVPQLLKVTLRQDIRNLLPWIVGVSALSASSILAYAFIFPSAADRTQLANALGSNPALSLVFGPARDLMTSDGFNAWRAGQLGAFLAGLMGILVVIRNSRANEDSGQAELIASGVLARPARLAVAVLVATLASVVLGVVCFLLTIACGGGATSSLILSASFAASALVFAGVAAIAAQVGSDARTASSLATATLGTFYVIRGYIDSSSAPGWVTWLTPLGWLEKARPATGNRPAPLLAALALAAVLMLIAFVLQGRRDFGQGLIAPRPGPARARLAGNAWGLALNLNRDGLIAWLIAFVGLGAIFGNLATSIGDIIAKNPSLARVLASGATDREALTFGFLVTLLQLLGIIAAVMGVQMMLRVYSEETELRVEPLLATSLRRRTYLASNAAIALVGPAVGMLLAGVGLGLVAHSKVNSVAVGDVVGQAAITILAVWVLIGLATAAVGAEPSRRVIAWLGIVATFALTLLGPTFKLPGWALGISPLHHVPNVTASRQSWLSLGGIGVVALVFLAIGFVGFRRRDII